MMIKDVLEVKCPYKYRDFRIDEMLKLELKDKEEKKAFFLKADGTVNERHGYWQIQAEMYATSVSWCRFCRFCRFCIRVLLDKDWGSTNIPKLVNFYINELLPTCCTKE